MLEVVPSLSSSLEPLAHHWNVASLSLFSRYYFGRCSPELAQLVPFPYTRGRSTRYSDSLHYLYVTISRCYKYVYSNNFFPHTARLWNSLPIECFPLTYDINGFKSNIFPECFNLFMLLFLVTLSLVVAVQPCVEWFLIF